MLSALPVKTQCGLAQLYLFDDQAALYLPDIPALIGLNTAATLAVIAQELTGTAGLEALNALLESDAINHFQNPWLSPSLPKLPRLNNSCPSGITIRILDKIFLLCAAEFAHEILAPFIIESTATP